MKISLLQFLLLVSTFITSNSFSPPHFTHVNEPRKYPISRPHRQSFLNPNPNPVPNPNPDPEKKEINIRPLFNRFKYPLSRQYYESYIKRLNSKNTSQQNEAILRGEDFYHQEGDDNLSVLNILFNETQSETENNNTNHNSISGFRVIISKNMFAPYQRQYDENNENNENNDYDDDDNYRQIKNKKSENFNIITKHSIKFSDIGGYENVKQELLQCVDILKNYHKYANYSVRMPKGIILEGPPGNGKTLLAKGFAGEAKAAFIAVSGSEFQEKYVGVGSSRVRELFKLAKKNAPCIVFIDEIDAIGRHRSVDGETSSSERDNTLNELLVALDGFKSTNGVFLIGATNRVDLLDPALTRPGRIDKKIFIGPPDSETREAILRIHSKGKPYDDSIIINDLVDLTMGLSGAQIENMLNEAMLNALREDRQKFTIKDVDNILNKMLAGWQPTEHHFNNDIIENIVIHEMGHAIVGLFAEHHSKMTKVIINFSSPRSPGYTVFEASESTIYTREALFEHLAILLAGRIAEETYSNVSITTGAINDFEEAYKLATKMIVYYGMGSKIIYPSNSDKYKEMIDDEVIHLIDEAYSYAKFIIRNSWGLIIDCADILKRDKIMNSTQIMEMIETGKYFF